MSESIEHIQDFVVKLKSQRIKIKEELKKLSDYKDFKENQEYKNSLSSEYSQLCEEIVELQKKLTRIRYKLDKYTDELYNCERYKLFKTALENTEKTIKLFEEVVQSEKERIENRGL